MSDATLHEREQVLLAAEASLARCDAAGALQLFERAASMAHAPDAELGIVRSHMQAGDYGRALAFCAHTATAHRDEPAGAALHAWLLNAGGQDQVARQVLARAVDGATTHRALAAVQSELARPWPCAHRQMLVAPARLAPYATATPRASVIATATLLPDGQVALVSLNAVRSRKRLWLRNGLGTTVAAQVGRVDAALGLAELRPAVRLPVAVTGAAPRQPFAGSAGFAAAYATEREGDPAWPLMRAGFIGDQTASGAQQLGIGLPPQAEGAPVFDGMGRLSGIALNRRGTVLLIGMPDLRQRMHGLEPASASPSPASSIDVEGVYAISLRHALQVLQG